MFKNSIIGILLGILYFIWIDEFYWLSFISLTTIITFCVWAIEETINDFKRKLVFKRRVNKQIDNIKITPQQADQSIIRGLQNNMTMLFVYHSIGKWGICQEGRLYGKGKNKRMVRCSF